jgi:hypothetical protein
MRSFFSRNLPDEARDLGALITEYRANSCMQLGYVILGAVFVPVGFVLLFGNRDWFPDHFIFRALQVGMGLFMICAGPLALWVSLFIMTRLRVLLFEEGFVVVDRRIVRTLRWEQIAEIRMTEKAHTRNGEPMYYTYSFAIRTRDGAELLLDDTLAGVEQLGRTIMRETKRHELKASLKAALGLETAGHWHEAIAAFEQVLRASPYNEIADQAREHVEQIRLKIAGHEKTL